MPVNYVNSLPQQIFRKTNTERTLREWIELSDRDKTLIVTRRNSHRRWDDYFLVVLLIVVSDGHV